MDDADVEEIRPAEPPGPLGGPVPVSVHEEITKRVCAECGRTVLAMGALPPPTLEDLRLPLCWGTCAVGGPADRPQWWFCPEKKLLEVPGVCRLRIERIDMLE